MVAIPLNIYNAETNTMLEYGRLVKLENLKNRTENYLKLTLDIYRNIMSSNYLNMIYNFTKCWQLIFLYCVKNKEINTDTLSEINRKVLLMEDYCCGMFRTELFNSKVLNSSITFPILTLDQINLELKDIFNMSATKLEIALEIFTFLVKSQCFRNGNKRTAYFITNYFCLNNNLPLLIFNTNNYIKYLGELNLLFNGGNEEIFKTFLLKNCLIKP